MISDSGLLFWGPPCRYRGHGRSVPGLLERHLSALQNYGNSTLVARCSNGRRSADDRSRISWRATRRSMSLGNTDMFDIIIIIIIIMFIKQS